MASTKTPIWWFRLDPKIDRTELDPGSLQLSRQELLRLYRAMRMSRTFELRLASLYRQGRVVGAVYLGIGREAIDTGVVSLLRPDDLFNTTGRNLSAWLYRGVEPKHILVAQCGENRDGGPLALGLLREKTNYGDSSGHASDGRESFRGHRHQVV